MHQGKIHISDFADTNPFPGLRAVASNSKLPVVLTSSLCWLLLILFHLFPFFLFLFHLCHLFPLVTSRE